MGEKKMAPKLTCFYQFLGLPQLKLAAAFPGLLLLLIGDLFSLFKNFRDISQ